MERRERRNAVTVLAPAKLNLALDVVGLLPNGYHALDMTMQTITLYERVVLYRSAGLSLQLPGSPVQPNDKNTAIKAALAFFHYTGLLAGVALLMGTEAAAGQLLRGERGRAGRVTLAITLHNLPEGMVVGLAAALGTAGDPEALAGAAALSLGIGLQNIPEGAAVSLPVRQAGASRAKAFGAGAASGLVEPAGAVLAALLAAPVAGALPWLLSMSAGAMLCATLEELVPAACGRGRAGMAALAVGFAVMMALDVALG